MNELFTVFSTLITAPFSTPGSVIGTAVAAILPVRIYRSAEPVNLSFEAGRATVASVIGLAAIAIGMSINPSAYALFTGLVALAVSFAWCRVAFLKLVQREDRRLAGTSRDAEEPAR